MYVCIWAHCGCTDGCEPSCWELNLGLLLACCQHLSLQSARPACSGQFCSLNPFSLWPKDLFIIIYKYTVVVFRCTRKGCQISLWGGCEPPCGCWNLNSGPSEEQSVLLPVEPSCQPRDIYFSCRCVSWMQQKAGFCSQVPFATLCLYIWEISIIDIERYPWAVFVDSCCFIVVVCVCEPVCVSACLWECVCEHVCEHVCMFTCMSVCVCVCVHTSTYTQVFPLLIC